MEVNLSSTSMLSWQQQLNFTNVGVQLSNSSMLSSQQLQSCQNVVVKLFELLHIKFTAATELSERGCEAFKLFHIMTQKTLSSI